MSRVLFTVIKGTHLTCGPANILASCSSARGAQQATCDARHETDAGAASCIRLSRPATRQTLPDPPNLPYPSKVVRGARATGGVTSHRRAFA
eukprot:319067-Prymnesium_polylepis.1